MVDNGNSLKIRSDKTGLTFNDIFKMNVLSSNGKPCIFPFKYDGESYAGCTIKDLENGTPWCAIGIDLDGYLVDDDCL